jgi:drug/metabolite transporter (DMT)-like permease
MTSSDSVAASRPLDVAATAIVMGLCVSWGGNQVAVKLAIPDIPPLIQGAVRSAAAALIVLAWARQRGVRLKAADGTLRSGTAAGLLFALEFILLYRGLLLTTASRAALLLYTAPLFVALGAFWLLPGERFGVVQWLGMVLAFGGVATALGWPQPIAGASSLFGDLMIIAAAAAWGATTLLIKATTLARAPFEKTLLYQLLVSAPLMGIAAAVFGEHLSAAPSAVALGALIYQTVWVVGITYLVWFALIMRYSASRLAAFTFLTPVFGVAAGHLVLGEPLTPSFLLALALVASGLVLVNHPALSRARRSP